MRTWRSAPGGQVSAGTLAGRRSPQPRHPTHGQTRRQRCRLPLLDRPHSTVTGDDLIEDLVVPGDGHGHRCRRVFPAPRRSFDIGQQKGDRARRKREPGRVRAAHLVHQQTAGPASTPTASVASPRPRQSGHPPSGGPASPTAWWSRSLIRMRSEVRFFLAPPGRPLTPAGRDGPAGARRTAGEGRLDGHDRPPVLGSRHIGNSDGPPGSGSSRTTWKP